MGAAGSGQVIGAGGAASKMVSRIGDSPALSRLASKISGTIQRSIDDLSAKLAQGNMNPGIGTKHLFDDIFYARARAGARVFFRQGQAAIKILGKATKQTEQQVINALEAHYRK